LIGPLLLYLRRDAPRRALPRPGRLGGESGAGRRLREVLPLSWQDCAPDRLGEHAESWGYGGRGMRSCGGRGYGLWGYGHDGVGRRLGTGAMGYGLWAMGYGPWSILWSSTPTARPTASATASAAPWTSSLWSMVYGPLVRPSHRLLPPQRGPPRRRRPPRREIVERRSDWTSPFIPLGGRSCFPHVMVKSSSVRVDLASVRLPCQGALQPLFRRNNSGPGVL
jgi:hypothetical protein